VRLLQASSGTTVFVDGVPSRFSAEDLQALFQPWGAVRAIMATHWSGHSLGSGCVEFATAGEADYAISLLNGREVMGDASGNPRQCRRISSRRLPNMSDSHLWALALMLLSWVIVTGVWLFVVSFVCASLGGQWYLRRVRHRQQQRLDAPAPGGDMPKVSVR
jgi:hypothetical protein